MEESNYFQEVNFHFELRKRKEKTIIKTNSEDLVNRPDKILQMLKKESVDLKSWFHVILYYYTIKDFSNFKKFSEELGKVDVELNPYYKEQKQIFIYILNIFSFMYSQLSQKTKDKEKCDNFLTQSTSYVNQAEKISMYDPMTMVCKGFLFFAQGDYDNSEMYFSNISDSDKNTNMNSNIVILAKLGRALNAYNKANYSKAIDYYISLIRDFDYVNENILESLGICYYSIGKLKKAQNVFYKIIEINPMNFKVQTYLSFIQLDGLETYLSNENLNEFMQEFSNIKQAYINDDEEEFPLLLISLVNIFLIAGKIQNAEEICTKLNNLLEYGEMKMANKENSKGKTEKYRRDIDDIKSAIYCVNAKISHFKNFPKDAFTWYRKSVIVNSKNIEAQFGLGQIYLSLQQNLAEAEKCFETCKSILERERGNCKNGTRVKSNSLNSLNETSFEINKYLAFIYARTRRKEIDQTVDMFKKALEIKIDDTDCYLELAQLLEFKKPEESLKLYEELLRLIKSTKEKDDKFTSSESCQYKYNQSHNLYNINDIMPEILNNIATIKIRLYLFTDVDKLLRESLSLINSMKNKSEIKNKREEHMAYKENTLRYNSLEQSIYFNLALYHEYKCEFADAYNYYKQIININPNFVEAYIKLGELARLRGNNQRAKEYMQLAVEKSFSKEKSATEGVQAPSDIFQLSNSLNPNIASLFPNQKTQKLIPVVNKPINPCLIYAQIQYSNGNEPEAINILTNILRVYDDHDPYTLVFLGNIYYELACQSRGKEDFSKNISRSLEMYYQALEADKYNAYAAIGIANIFAEYNLTNTALDTYKMITEKNTCSSISSGNLNISTNCNAFINEALIYMSEGKFEKSTIILSKLLKRAFRNKFPEIENVLAKSYMEMKDFENAKRLLKDLIMRYPENIYYKFNYALCLQQRAEEILLKSERRVKETEEAIRNLEKSIPIFDSLLNSKREINANFRNDKEEKYLKTSEFFNKCNEILQFLHLTLVNARDTLLNDKLREQEILNKIEENKIRYNKMLSNMQELNERERNEIKRKMMEEEKLAESYKEKVDQIILMKEKMLEEKNKKGRKDKEKKNDNDEEDLNIVKHENNDSSSDSTKKKRKHKKNKKNKKKHHQSKEELFDPDDESYEYKKMKKLKKKHRPDQDLDLFADNENNINFVEGEENMYQGLGDNLFTNVDIPIKEENQLNDEDENKELNSADNIPNNIKTNSLNIINPVLEIEMKDYSKNEIEEEVDFS